MGRFSPAAPCHANSVYECNGKGLSLMQSLIELPHTCFLILIQVILVLIELVWCFKGWRVQAAAVCIGDVQHSSPALWCGCRVRLSRAERENLVFPVRTRVDCV